MTRARAPVFVLVAAALILMLALGTRQGFGLFLQPMCSALGWGRETFSAAIALQNLVWGLAQPFTGMIADRYGAARVTAVGGLLYTVGLVMMAYSTTGPALDVSAGLMIGLGLSGASFGVVLGVVGRVVAPERRTTALGLVGAGGSIGQFVMLPYGQVLISQFGWFTALLVLAASAFLIVPLAAAFAGKGLARTSSVQQPIAAALREAGAHKGFWLATVSFAVCGFQTVFIMTHLPAYMVDRGATAVEGMTALAVIGFANIAGSLGAGALGDRYRKKNVLVWIYAVRAVAIAAFIAAPPSQAATWAFAIVLGLTWLGTVPLTNALVAQIFGVQYLSTLFSIAWLGHQIGGFLGAWLGGYVYDATGSYFGIWMTAIAASVVAAVMCLPIDERPLARTARA